MLPRNTAHEFDGPARCHPRRKHLTATVRYYYLQFLFTDFKTLYVQHLNIKFHTAQSTVQDRVERVQSRNQCDG